MGIQEIALAVGALVVIGAIVFVINRIGGKRDSASSKQ